MKACDWSRHFNLQKKSGMTIEKYCKANGVSISGWYSAKQKIISSAPLAGFAKVVIKDQPKAKELSLTISQLPDGSIEFSGVTSDPRLLLRVLSGGQI